MATTTYTDGVTVLTADTANDLNRLHYTILSDPADAAAVRTALALTIGTNVQAQGATLTSLEGLSLVAGDILYATAADTLQRLAKGTASQEIRMNAGATAPEWFTSTSSGVSTDQGHNNVGSFCFGGITSPGTAVNGGQTYSGASITDASVFWNGTVLTIATGNTMAGTWRALSTVAETASRSFALFQRIS